MTKSYTTRAFRAKNTVPASPNKLSKKPLEMERVSARRCDMSKTKEQFAEADQKMNPKFIPKRSKVADKEKDKDKSEDDGTNVLQKQNSDKSDGKDSTEYPLTQQNYIKKPEPEILPPTSKRLEQLNIPPNAVEDSNGDIVLTDYVRERILEWHENLQKDQAASIDENHNMKLESVTYNHKPVEFDFPVGILGSSPGDANSKPLSQIQEVGKCPENIADIE